MSMTREKAIKALRLERGIEINGNAVRVAEFLQGLDVALSVLRPVSREQVEKVWRGEWIGDNDEKVGTIDGSPMKSATCFACGNWLVGSDEYDCSGHFCPACGRAMTDEAVQMVMERLEALNEM